MRKLQLTHRAGAILLRTSIAFFIFSVVAIAGNRIINLESINDWVPDFKSYLNQSDEKAEEEAEFEELMMMAPYDMESLSSGSVIIDMGQIPQTLDNTLKAYGLVYYVVSELNVPIKWIINPMKDKDGTDFSHNGVNYKGGPFIIPAEYVSSNVLMSINNWNTNNASGALNLVQTISEISVPVYTTITYYPRWTLDEGNGGIAEGYIQNAGIPETAYNWKDPQNLDCCDQLFAMPHADPVWETHSNLYFWNLNCDGGIWAACHAVSALENTYDNITPNPSLQMNFLSTTRSTAPGIDALNDWAENSLILWGDHDDGSLPPPYITQTTAIAPGPLNTKYNSHPAMQFMGVLDGAQENGSESMYMPYNGASWRSTTAVAIYDDSQDDVLSGNSPGEAAKLVFGEAFGDSDRGVVMYEAGHSHDGGAPENVAAQRAFHNFSLWALEKSKINIGDISPMTSLFEQGDMESFSVSPAPTGGAGMAYNYDWSVTPANAGSFDNPFSSNPTFTAATGQTYPIQAVITVKVTDNCGTNVAFNSLPVSVVAGPPGITTNPDMASVCEDYCLEMIDVLGNDVFIGTSPTSPMAPYTGYTINITSVTPSSERVSVNADNTLKYWPSLDNDGTVTVTYQVCDATNFCSSVDGVLTITVDSDMCADGLVCLDPETPGAPIFYGDDFEDTDLYGQNHGNKCFAGSWNESADGNNATGGDIKINGSNQLEFNKDKLDADEYIERSIGDLTGVTSASVTFDWSPSDDFNSSDDTYELQLSPDGGSPIVLFTFNETSQDNMPIDNDNEMVDVAAAVSGAARTFGAGAYVRIVYKDGDKKLLLEDLEFTFDSDIFRDNFDATSYGLKTAMSECWGGPWIENGDDDDPANGDFKIKDARLEVNSGITDGDYIQRAIGDLTDIIDASVSLDWSPSEDFNSSDDVLFLYFSPDGGAPILIFTFNETTQDANSGIDMIDVDAAVSAATRSFGPGAFVRIEYDGGDKKLKLEDISFSFAAEGQGPCDDDGCINCAAAYPVATDDGPLVLSTSTMSSLDIPVLQNDAETNDIGDLTVSLDADLSSPANGSLTLLTPTGNAGDATNIITYTPDPGYTGTETFQYRICDDACRCAVATVTVDVQAAGPVTMPDDISGPMSINTCEPLIIDVLANDTDPLTLLITSVQSTGMTPTPNVSDQGAALEIITGVDGMGNPTQLVRYIPPSTITSTTDMFTYTVDNGTGTATETVTVMIDATLYTNLAPTPMNDSALPVIAGDPAYIPVLSNDTDPEGYDLTVTSTPADLLASTMSTPAFAWGGLTPTDVFAISATGQISFFPPVGFLGTVTFTYTVTDEPMPGNGCMQMAMSASAMVTLDVINQAPIAYANHTSTGTDQMKTINVLNNDVEPDGNPIDLPNIMVGDDDMLTTMGMTALGGMVSVNMDGTIEYTPPPGQSGVTDEFYYKICDVVNPGSFQLCDIAKVTVEITAPIDLELTKSVSPTFLAAPGSNVTYTLTVRNNSSSPATTVVVDDDLPAGVSFVSASPMGVYDPLSGSWFVGNLDPNDMSMGGTDEATLMITVTVNDLEDTYNFAQVTNADQSDINSEPGNNTSGIPNENDEAAAALMDAEIEVTKAVLSYTDAASGTQGNYDVTYEYVVTNTGDFDLSNVSLIDDLQSQYGGAFIDKVSGPSITSSVGTTPGTANGGYDGTSMDPELLGLDAVLEAGNSITIALVVEIDPNSPTGIFDGNMNLVNQATTAATSAAGMVTDVSDDITDLNGDMMLDNDSGGDDDATLLKISDIRSAKTFITIEEATSGTPGNYDVTVSIIVRNTGNEAIANIGVTDDIGSPSNFGTTLVDIIIDPAISNSTIALPANVPGINPGFDGTSDIGITDTTGMMAPGEEFTIEFVIEVDPDAAGAPMILGNQGACFYCYLADVPAAPGRQQSTSRMDDLICVVGDLTDSGIDPESTNPLAPGDTGSADDVSLLVIPANPEISVTKAIVPSPVANIDGTYTVSYQFGISNTGDVALSNINLLEDFQNQYGCAFKNNISGLIVTPFAPYAGMSPPTANGSYSGEGLTINMLNGNGIMLPGDSITVTVSVDIDPSCSPVSSPLDNQATATGTPSDSGGIPLTDSGGNPLPDVSDLSDDKTDYDANGMADNDSGGTDDPTLLYLPGISVAKAITDVSILSNGDAKLTFELEVENTGNAILSNITLDDPLTFLPVAAPASQDISVSVSNISADAPPVANDPGYTGETGGTGLLDGMSGKLLPGQKFLVTMMVEVNPAVFGGLTQPVTNQAVASGIPVDALDTPLIDPATGVAYIDGAVSDESDDGTGLPDNGDPGDENTGSDGQGLGMNVFDDPTPIVIPAIIDLVKTAIEPVLVPSTDGIPGHADATFEFTVCNNGGSTISGVNIEDNFSTEYGAGFKGIAAAPSVPTGTASTLGGPAAIFTGLSPNDKLLDGTAVLDPGQCLTTSVTVIVDLSALPVPAFNQAEATGTDESNGSPITDLSDNNSPADPDNPMSDDDDPTPFPPAPALGVSKAVTSYVPATSGTMGNYDVEYTFIIENIGNVLLSNLSLVDDFETQFGAAGFVGVVSGPNVINISAAVPPMVNMAYDGNEAASGNDDMLLGDPSDASDRMNVGEQFSVTVTVEIDPSEAILPLLNQSVARGIATDDMGDPILDITGMPLVAMDDSDNGMDPTTTNDDGIGNTPTPLMLPGIGISKTISTMNPPVPAMIPGNYIVTYEFVVENIGTEPLNNLMVVDDLSAQLGTAFVGVVPASVAVNPGTATMAPIANPSYDGTAANQDMLMGSPSDNLEPGQFFGLSVQVEIDPDAAGAPMMLLNQAMAIATDPNGEPTMDLSDNGTDPETDNGEGNFEDPTPLPPLPSIAIVKDVLNIAPAASNAGGNVDITFLMVVQNTGNTNLTNLSLVDDMVTQFGVAGFQGVIPMSLMVNTGSATAGPTANPGYDGTNDMLIPAPTDLLEPGQSFSVQVSVEVDPSMATMPLLNQATASAQPIDMGGMPIGGPVMDLSDDGTDPVTDNGDMNFDTPTLVEVPAIGVAKEAMVNPIELPNGNFEVTYNFIIENIGNIDLTAISLIDNLAAQLGGAFIKVVSVPIASLGGGNAGYTGDGIDPELLDLTANLIPGQIMTASVTVEIDPDNPTAIYGLDGALENSASAAGNYMLQDGTQGVAMDLSEDGTTSDGSDANMDGSVDTPTGINVPAIRITKSIADITVQNETAEITFVFNVQNTGNEVLTALRLTDMLPFPILSSMVTVTSPPTMGPLVGNPMYDGVGMIDVIDPASGDMSSLDPGDVYSVELVINAALSDLAAAPTPTENQATATGINPSMVMVSDISDDGTGLPGNGDPTTNNPGADNDQGTEDDPTIIEVPAIRVAKSIVSGPVSAVVPGNYYLTYEFVIENAGNVSLDNISLKDPFAGEFGLAYIGPSTSPATIMVGGTASVPGAGNSSFTGLIGNEELLDGNAVLDPGQQLIVSIEIEVDPDANNSLELANQAVASGDTPGGDPVSDLSDSGTTPLSNNLGEPGDTGSSDDPTPFPPIPSLGVSKAVASIAPAASGTMANYDVTYDLAIVNNGNVILNNLSLVDDLDAQIGPNGFVDLVSGPTVTPGTATVAPVENGIYDGGDLASGNIEMLLGDPTDPMDRLEPGQSYQVSLVAEVDPSMSIQPILNQATASGDAVDDMGMPILDPAGAVLQAVDDSDNGTDPLGNNGDGNGDTPTPLILPGIGISKAVSTTTPPVPASTPGNYIVTYELNVFNTGTEILSNISVVDDLASQLGSGFQSVVTGSVTVLPGTATMAPAANPAYSGMAPDSDFLIGAATDALEPDQLFTITVEVEVDPDANGIPDPATNQALATALDPNDEPVSDLSDNGFDPEGDNGEGGFEDPTPLPPLPSIMVAKDVVDVVEASSGNGGNFDVTFSYIVKNTGNVNMTDLVLKDDMLLQFGAAGFIGVIPGSIAVNNITASSPPDANVLFDGVGGSEDDLLDDMSMDNLKPGELFEVVVTVEIDPSAALMPLTNQAEVTGLPTDDSGMVLINPLTGSLYTIGEISDLSDDGVDPTSDNGDGDFDTPSPIEIPALGLAKMATLTLPALDNGNYSVTYDYIIENIGNTVLTSVGLEDDLVSQMGGAFIQVLTSPTADVGGGNMGYNGNGNSQLLDLTASLNPGEVINVQVVVEIDPDNPGSVYGDDYVLENSGTTSGDYMLSDGTVGSVNDESEDGTTSDGSDANMDGDNDTPTPLQIPSIGLAKEVSGVAEAATQGNFTISYDLIIQNTGNTVLDNVSLADDIASQLGIPPYVSGSAMATTISGTGAAPGGLSGTYDGEAMTEMLDGTGILQPGEQITVGIKLEVDASFVSNPPQENTATATGNYTLIDNTGGMVSDDSENGNNPDGSDVNGDMNVDTPTPLPPLPHISLAKYLSEVSPSESGVPGNVDATFTFEILNDGTEILTDLSLVDNLLLELGSVFVSAEDPVIDMSTATSDPSINSNYTGVFPFNDLFSGGGILEPGQTITVSVTLEVDPNAPFAPDPLANQAEVEGDFNDGNNIITVSDLSDSGVDPEDENPDAPGHGTGDNPYDDPTVLEFPSIMITKELTEVVEAASNVVGNFDITFSLLIENTGNIDLSSITLEDDIVTQFGGTLVGVNSPATFGPATTATTNPTISAGFIGPVPSPDIFNGDDGLLEPGQLIEVVFTVEVDPDAVGAPSPLIENQATAGGDSPSGINAEDDSDSGTIPESTNPGAPGDTGGHDDPTPIPIPDIHVAKSLVAVVESANGVEGNVDITLQYVVENTGNLNLDNLSLTDDLEMQLGPAFTGVVEQPMIVASSASLDPVTSMSYTGSAGGTDMLDGISGLLQPDEQFTLQVVVEVDPNAEGSPDPLTNQATASGDDPEGNPTDDLSDSGTTPEDNNPGEPGDTGGEDDPTELRIPSISLAKTALTAEFATSGAVGNFDVTYQLILKNTGNVDLDSIQVYDDLTADMMSAFVRIVPEGELGIAANPYIVSSDAIVDPVLNGGFTGMVPNDSIFDGITGLLPSNGIIVIEFVAEINPNANDPVDTLFNQATAEATGPADDNFPVSDLSDSGTDPEGDNPDDPGDMDSSEDPTPLILSDINIAKNVSNQSLALSEFPGNVDVTFELIIKNKGNDTLTQLQLMDDLQSQLGDQFVRLIPSSELGAPNPEIIMSSATETPTLAAGYSGGSEGLFTGTDGKLGPNELITIQLVAEVDPDAVDANMDGTPDTLYNQAMVMAVNPMGMTVMDESDSGTDPESNNPGADGDTGGMNDPTPILSPVINAAKEVTGYQLPASGTEGHLDVLMEIIIKNTGNVPLENISLYDTMSNDPLLGPAFVGIAPGGEPMIVSSTATMDPVINPVFDGTDLNPNIFDGTSGILSGCDSVRVALIVEINPALAMDPEELYNQAYAAGDYEGETVTDPTDSGTDPKTTNPDGEKDTGGHNDPTPIYSCLSNCEVAAKELVHLSLDEMCMAEVKASNIGVGIPYYCDFYYSITIEDEHGNVLPSNKVDGSYLGQKLKVSITEPECGNTAWGYVLVEDKLPPTIICEDVIIPCVQAMTYDTPPVVEDNCWADIEMVNEVHELIDCDDDYIGKIRREWIATDGYGNQSEVCEQTIWLLRTDLSRIMWPSSHTVLGNNALECGSGYAEDGDGNPDPSVTGVPKLNGVDLYPFDANIICNGFVEYDDRVIQSTNCYTRIERVWTVGEWWCSTVNDQIHVQVIEIDDTQAPVITACPSDITVSTDSRSCMATVELPPVEFVDACGSPVKVSIVAEQGSLNDSNGGLIDLEAGLHTVTYVVTDKCGNSNTCEVDVLVKDEKAPVIICEQDLVVSLGGSGNARLQAIDLDLGSFDECTKLTYEARRMTDACDISGTDWGEEIHFCCADAGQIVMVLLRVTDKSGNSNECMVEVRVQDKLPPRMECIDDVTINCTVTFDMDNLDMRFGFPQIVTDNCPENNDIRESFVTDINQCGIGSIHRTFQLFDGDGVFIQECDQWITIEGFTDSDLFVIDWPEDYNADNLCSGDDLHPDNLPVENGWPSVPDDLCTLIGMDYSDEFYDATTGDEACFKIIRTWKVIDWCNRDSSATGNLIPKFEWEQVIKINNTIDPTITGDCSDRVFESLATDCGDVRVQLNMSGIDDCTPPEDLLIRYEIDEDNDGDIDYAAVSDEVDQFFPLGTHSIRWEVEDRCGNITSCEYEFETRNVKAPTPICIDGLSIDLQAMDMDGDLVADTVMAILTPDMIDGKSSHPCANPITLSFSSDPTDQELTFSCSDVGENMVELWVTDIFGNQAFCITRIQITANGDQGLCGDGVLVNINGRLSTMYDASIEEVEVTLIGSELPSEMTGSDGLYAFNDMVTGGSYEVVPEKDDDPTNGVSTLDIVHIQRHILGIAEITDPYLLVAADVNGSGSVTATDIIELRKLILGHYDNFPNNTSWRFVDATYEYTDPQAPWDDEAPQSYRIQELTGSMNIDFIGMKVGDISGDASANLRELNTGSRSEATTWISIKDQYLLKGETTTIGIRAGEEADWKGLQLEMKMGGVEVLKVGSDHLEINEGHYRIDGDRLVLSLNDEEALLEDGSLFYLEVEAVESGYLSEMIALSEERIASEVYVGTTAKVTPIEIRWENGGVGTFAVKQNIPNPWSEVTRLDFSIPRDGEVKVIIRDVAGKQLRVIDDRYRAGNNSIVLRGDEIRATGVLLYEVYYGGERISGRMIKVK